MQPSTANIIDDIHIPDEDAMIKHEYLDWMTHNTPSRWCNDSAIADDLESALASGAIGCTSNPPLTYEALTTHPDLYKEAIAQIPAHLSGDDRVVELLGVVVRPLAARLMPLYRSSDGAFGYVRSQVQPGISADAAAMYRQGKTIAAWGENVMVKIPGTAAGMQALEDLAADGIPTNPTVCPSVAQIIAAAQANERGIERALAAGRTPAASTAAIVMGRLQDYLSLLNEERKAGLSKDDLDWAILAVAKRCYRIIRERGYRQILMPAAFRSPIQVAGLCGAQVHMTIHPKVQKQVIEAERAGRLPRRPGIDDPVAPSLIERVSRALPEFARAYDPNGLKPEEFGTFGATAMTLDGFDKTGWQKLRTL